MKKPKLEFKENHVFLVEFQPKNKKDCDNLIKAIRLSKAFIREILYSKPETK